MVSVNATCFLSRSSNVNTGGSFTSESITNLAQMGLRNRTAAHSSLKSMNKLDFLQFRSNAKAIPIQYRGKTGHRTNCHRPSSAIRCQSGMNMVFVGTEVGPWSKTGGLGDVLGGLPPAMAVSIRLLLHCFFHLQV